MSLKPEQVRAAISSGRNQKIAAGHNLYLLVRNRKAFWVHQFRDGNVIRSHGLGPASGENAVTPAAARRAREAFMADKRRGVAVIPRRAAKGEAFGTAAASYLEIHADEWGKRQAADFASLLRRYIPRDFADKAVTEITAENVAEVLKPIWTGPGNNKGSRLRRLIQGMLASKDIDPNPARWGTDGTLREKLSKKRSETVNRPAMPWQDVPAFAATLGDGVEDRAGRFVMLTGARRKEALAARWSEFDFAERIWTVPKERMKMRRVHRVPLTDEMIACLGEPGSPDAFVFPSTRTGRMLGNKSLDKEWVPNGFTLHGFRTSVTTWAQEQGDGHTYAMSAIKAAIAHNPAENEADKSYLRSDLFDARRKLMEAWSKFVTGRM
jgi:integrase